MKTYLKLSSNILLALTLAGVLITASVSAAEPPATANATNTFAITGMHCDGCAKGITGELKLTPGVVSADISFSNKLAVVAYDTNRVSSARLIKVVEEAGYQAKLKQP